MQQHVTGPTRTGGGGTPSVTDHSVTYSNLETESFRYNAPFGKSDLAMLELELVVSEYITVKIKKKPSPRRDTKPVNYTKLSNFVGI